MIDNEKTCGATLIIAGIIGLAQPLFRPFVGIPLWFVVVSISFIAIGIYVYFIDEWPF